jgi:hypothetical protein
MNRPVALAIRAEEMGRGRRQLLEQVTAFASATLRSHCHFRRNDDVANFDRVEIFDLEWHDRATTSQASVRILEVRRLSFAF